MVFCLVALKLALVVGQTCSPEVITFSQSVDSEDFESPFRDFNCPRTNLQLVEGNFKLKNSVFLDMNLVASEKLVIEGILCQGGVTANCYPAGTRPIILLQNVEVQLLMTAPTVFRNVKFSHQFPFKLGCESCTYCPSVTQSGLDVINDRGEVLVSSQYLDSSYCEPFNRINFLTSRVSIELENVSFSDFRMGFKSILFIETGKAVMKKVDFSNIIVKVSAILSGNHFIDSVVYEGGFVELLNNGFEIDTNLVLGNFLTLDKVTDFRMKGLEMKNNIYSGNSNLIQLNNIKNLMIGDCKFSLNIVNGNLIKASQEGLKLVDHDHNSSFVIRNLSFSESMANNFIEIKYDTSFQTVLIDNCSFTNSVLNAAAISTSSNLYDFSLDPHNILDFNLSNLLCRENYSPFQISISQLKKVSLFGLKIEENYIKNDLGIKIANEIMKDERVYFKKVYNPILPSSSLSSINLLYFRKIDLFYIENLNIINNYGSALIADMISIIYIKNLISLSNIASNYHLFYFFLLYQSSLDDINLLNNSITDTKYSLMSIKTHTSFLQMNITNSFLHNSNGSILVESCKSINIDNFTVFNSSTPTNSYLKLKFVDDSSFSLKNSIFLNNSDDVLSLGSSISTIKVDILIENITVNNSKGSLGMIQFENSLFLYDDRNSFIRNSRFEKLSGIIISILSYKGNVQIINCNFSENTGSSVNIFIASSSNITINASKFINSLTSSISFQKASDYNTLTTNNCLFSNISNTMISISLSNYTDYASTFEYNQGLLISGSAGSGLKFISSKIIRNINFSSLFYCIFYSHLILLDVIFDSNESLHKSIIFIENESYLQMNNTLFINNTGYRGSVLFIQHSPSYLSSINSSTFKLNHAILTNTIFLLESNLSIDHSDFIENYSNDSAGVHLTYESFFKLSNSRFIGHVGEYSCIRAEDSSRVEVYYSEFLNSSEESSGTLIKTSESYFKCLGCKFSRITLDSGNLIYSWDSFLEFFHMDLVDVKVDKSFGLIYLSFASMCFGHRVFVQNFTGTAFYNDLYSTLVLNDSIIRYGISEAGTGILCKICLKISLNLVNFDSLTAETDGGCLYSYQDRYGLINYVNSSSFNSCVGQNGGSLMLLDSSYNIDNSTFTSNHAISVNSQGGSIFQSNIEITSSLTISSSTFKNNSAVQSGGAIQWYSSKPDLKSLNFSSNKAFYGPDLGSFTESLHLQGSSRSLSSQIFPPGEPSPSPLKVDLKDHYNQTVLTDNSTKLILYSKNPSFQIQGQFISQASEGSVEFSDIKIFGAPKSESQILITTESNNNHFTSELEIEFVLRECVAGEQLVQGIHCEKCKNDSYSLKPGKKCLSCPEGGVCFGADFIFANPGFWRRNNRTDKIFKCFNEKACLGDYNSSKCEKGYKGNLCQVCSQGFSSSQGNECNECLDKDLNIGRIITILILVAGFLAFQSYSTIQAVYKERSVTSVYLKILVNYLQLVSLTIGFELDWPRLVKKLFAVQEKASSSSDQFISFDCFLSDYYNPFFSKVLIISLTPVICLTCSMIFWLLWKKVKHSEKVMEKFIGTVIVQLFFFYPSLIRLDFLTFFCTELEKDNFYLTSYMNIHCWKSTHLIFTLTVALPSIVTFCISFPLVLLVSLRKNSENLQDESQKLKYGFLYNGFSDKFYYWEFLVILRKLLIIIFFVFFSRISVPIQALCTFVVILISFLLQLRFQPYINSQLNTLELMSILVTAVTIYSGIFFLTGDLSEEAKIIVFVLMVLSNFIFLAFWIYLTFAFFFAKLYLKTRICRRVFKGRFDRWATKIHPVTQMDEKKNKSTVIFYENKSCFKEPTLVDVSPERIN